MPVTTPSGTPSAQNASSSSVQKIDSATEYGTIIDASVPMPADYT